MMKSNVNHNMHMKDKKHAMNRFTNTWNMMNI